MATAPGPNDAFCAALESNTAASAVFDCTRFLLYHRFTGRLKRGFTCRILPPRALRTQDEWAARGISASLLGDLTVLDGKELYAFVYDGELFYEIAETRLAREDYSRRLSARTVAKWEWRLRQASLRKLRRSFARVPGPTSEQQEAFAYTVMGELVAGIVAHARRTEGG